MRTTLTIEDNLAKTLRALAHRSGKPFKDIVNDTLRAGLTAGKILPRPRAYTLEPRHMGRVQGDLNLDKALALADRLEDEELIREPRMHK